MPAIFGYSQSCRTHRPTCAAVVDSLLRPYSFRPVAWRGHDSCRKRKNLVRKPVSCGVSQRVHLGNSQNGSASHAQPSCPPEYQIRRARPDEADQVADLNAEVRCQTKLARCVACWILQACSACMSVLRTFHVSMQTVQSISLCRLSHACVPGLCVASIQGYEPGAAEAIY